MASTKQAKKRIRQNEKRRLINRSRMSRTRTAVKAAIRAAVEVIDKPDGAEAARAAFRRASSELDRAARRNIIHRNAASRTKSRLAKRLAKAEGAATG